MLELDLALPPGALCDGSGAALGAVLRGTQGAVWWSGTEDAFGIDPETYAVAAWNPLTGTAPALPTEPNTGNAQVGATGDLSGLQCREGIHAGLWAEAVVDDPGTVTMAIRYVPTSASDPLTLLTLNTGGSAKKGKGQNYLFLSEAEGVLTVKDDAGLVELTLPVQPKDLARLVLVSLTRDALLVSILGGPSGTARPRAPVLQGAASLFIGCRNHRPGLLKTLGGALISDVWLLPGRAILGSDADTDRSLLTAFQRFHLWSGDGDA